ncbi:hypothetical protein LEP1GSC049_4236 [Leptospira kirschneri serovar Cynopteri str. 3522 CT]|nr:hypothetical protein LEP1GSC064_1785 [Leptospira kirschneri serovar Grippotyphosa str. Moskva]EKR07721.1 hypothetical protein LEP1GSC122_2425 [Leptospira kirschneri serovar Valbuzzi str. 200702274]EMN25298.1 hypothetical protein LEP1GSC065_3144 [Leptospira kirschneri serovar Sokoine str. RM1]EPG48170.1 hypothetical protein LEP1GSC049_4236 [Leptospira kirschneri serovar Cynopteri str. 3522 CT]
MLKSKLKNKNKIYVQSLKKLNITSIITFVQDFLRTYNKRYKKENSFLFSFVEF